MLKKTHYTILQIKPMKSKVHVIFSLLLTLGSVNAFAQIGIGTKTPAPSAALEVSSTGNNKGVLITRLTATQKDAIVSPAEGLLVYQTTAPTGFYYYTGTAWKLMAVQTDVASKVDKVDGKDLSSNDYTTAEKTKLSAITGTNTGDQTTITGNAGTATKLAASKNINGLAFDGTADITVSAAAETLTGTTLKSTVTGSSLTSVGTLANLTVTNPIAGSVTGNAGTATNLTGLTTSVATLNNLSGVNTGDQTTITGNAGTVTTNANLTGPVTSVGNATAIADGAITNAKVTDVAATKITGTLPVANGGTGASTAAAARTSLELGNIDNTTDLLKPISTLTQTALNLKAPLASPTLTGTPLAPTATAGTNTTQIATTQFVTGAITAAGGVDLTTNQTIAGQKTFSSDISVNGVKIGRGLGNDGQNVAIGADALASGTGTRNTAVGYGAMRQYSGTSFDNNTSIGYFNLPVLTSGSGNTSIGAESMMALTTGAENTSVGNQSLINTTGNNNVGVGKRAGQTITTGSQNTIIGTNADVATAAITNASAIGYGASAATSNTIQLGNTSVTNIKTSGTITADAVTYPKAHGTAGQVLSTTGSGTLAWTTPAAGPIFKQSRVKQTSTTGTADSEIEVGGMAFRYNKEDAIIQVKRTTNLESEWQTYNTSRIESGVSTALNQKSIISTGGGFTQLNGSFTISGYYNSYEFEMTPYVRGQASDNHSFNIKVLLDGWGYVTLRVVYY